MSMKCHIKLGTPLIWPAEMKNNIKLAHIQNNPLKLQKFATMPLRHLGADFINIVKKKHLPTMFGRSKLWMIVVKELHNTSM